MRPKIKKQKLAFVLSGGGAYGALQVGALRALFESGIQPDMIIGTSIGAINAAFLAVKGLDLGGVHNLTWAWRETIGAEILPANYIWLSVRQLVGRPETSPAEHLRDFFLLHGIPVDKCFGDITGVELYTVAADLNHCQKVIYGTDPQHQILEGILASAALPPWVRPIESEGRYLVDGAFVSNTPIEPAMNLGATAMIILDLSDPMGVQADTHKERPFLGKIIDMTVTRYRELELALAAARKVPFHDIVLASEVNIDLWDFSRTDELMERGYRVARGEIDKWPGDDFAWQWRQPGREMKHFGEIAQE